MSDGQPHHIHADRDIKDPRRPEFPIFDPLPAPHQESPSAPRKQRYDEFEGDEEQSPGNNQVQYQVVLEHSYFIDDLCSEDGGHSYEERRPHTDTDGKVRRHFCQWHFKDACRQVCW